jgi:hypothetical protein
MKICKVFLTLLCGVTVIPVWAEAQSTTTLSLSLSSLPEAQVSFAHDIAIPMLRGDGPFTSGNNLTVGLKADVSPITMDGILNLTLTPVAFLQFNVGGLVSTGWDFIGLHGLGRQDWDGTNWNTVQEPFTQALWQVWAAGVFQFDLGAVIPGDWTHILFQTRQEVNYQSYTGATDKQYWEFKADGGENRNGVKYYASYVLGYQIPSPVLNMVGMMFETERKFYTFPSAASRKASGDDRMAVTISTLFNFKITDRLSALFLTIMETQRNFATSTKHYPDRVLEDEEPLQLVFNKFALVVNYSLK